jgi:hypothetical protein
MPLLDLSGGWHRDRSERRAVIEGVVADVGEVCGEVDVGEGSAPLEGKVLDVEGGARGRRGDVVGKGDSCEGGAALEGAGAERGEAGGEADSRERAAAGEGSVAYSVNTPVLRV